MDTAHMTQSPLFPTGPCGEPAATTPHFCGRPAGHDGDHGEWIRFPTARREPQAHARASDPSTSHEAAQSVAHLRESQQAVLDCLRLVGPSHDEDLIRAYDEVHERHHWPRQSPSGLRSRRKELVVLEKVKDTGRKIRTDSGRGSIVWEAVG